ncbi:MAG TPA: hypothetical protein VLG25_00725 [Patescibacteria group bacterium]|nr:hypothetical protein [Patescibacteria group bacterium]
MKLALKKFKGAQGLFFALLLVLALMIGLAVYIVTTGNRILQTKTDQLIALKLDSHTLDEQQKSLVQAKRDIEKYSDLEKIAATIVPQEKDQARTVREIIKIAADNGITISNISFTSSSLGNTTVKSTPTTTQTETTTQATTTKVPTTQVKPVDGINGLYVMEINVQTNLNKPVPYQNLLNFLQQLEQNRRTSQVTNITVQPDSKDRSSVTFTLTLNVYIKP